MTNTKVQRTIFLLVLMQFLLAACSAPQATPTIVQPSATPPVQIIKDIPYLSPLASGVSEEVLDVYAPFEGDSWPVVVLLHKMDAAKEGYSDEVQAIAEQGVVVFNIDWPEKVAENSQGYRLISEALSCAIHFARAAAADYGGDPSRIILVGHGFGARRGAWIALAGDSLTGMWDAYSTDHGGPEPQVACLKDGGSSNVDAFIGIGGHYPNLELMRESDEDLWKIVSQDAHFGQRPDLLIRLLHGEQDIRYSFEKSVELNDILTEEGYDTRLILFEGRNIVPIPLTIDVILELVLELGKQ